MPKGNWRKPAPLQSHITLPGETRLTLPARKQRPQRSTPDRRAALRDRRRRARMNDPAQITQALTPRLLRQELAAAERLKFGDEDRQIAGELAASDAQQGRITNWYDQYKQQVAAAAAQQKAAEDTANAQITALQAATGQQQVPAAPQGSEASLADAQAAAARKASVGSFGAMLATQGAARGAYMADKGRIAAGDEVQQHLEESGRKRSLGQAQRDIAQDKGAFRIAYRQDARDKERRNALENAAFGLNQQKAAADVALSRAAQKSLDRDRRADNRRQKQQDRRQRMESDRKYRLDLDKFGAAKAKDNYQKAHGLGPYKVPSAKDGEADKGLSPSEIRMRRKDRNKAWSEVETVAADMGSLGGRPFTDDRGTPDKGDDRVRKPNREEIFAELRRGGASQDQIIVALALRHGDKTWDARTIAAAKRLGIRVPKRYRPVKPPPTGTSFSPGPSGQTRPN